MTEAKVIVGDAFELLPGFESNSFNLILTDPPYDLDQNRTRIGKKMETPPISGRMEWLAREFERVLKPGGFLVIFSGVKSKYGWYPALAARLRHVTDFAWVYPNSIKPKQVATPFWTSWELAMVFSKGPGRFNREVVTPLNWASVPAPNGVVRAWDPDLRDLPEGVIPKPVEIGEIFVRRLTEPGDWVLDPFCGSGSFLVAAVRNGRNAVGIEIREDLARFAERRVARAVKQRSLLDSFGG